MKKVIFFFSWFVLTIVTFILSISTLQSISAGKKNSTLTILPFSVLNSHNPYQVYSSLPQIVDSYTLGINKTGATADIVRFYLEKYRSPFKNFSQEVILSSDKYKTENVPDLWRYIIAIAQCESNLGHRIPPDSYNAWGLGIVTGAESGMTFTNWAEGIEAEAKFLRQLIDRGLYTPEEWGPIYAPPSVLNNNSWAKCVREFLPDLE